MSRLTPARFWYLRHGQTDWNVRDLAQGHTDVPLNAHGLAQAQAMAEKLRGQSIASIVSSPMIRARTTAETVAAALGLPVAIEPELHETSFGEREGQPMAEWFRDWIAGTSTPESGEPFAALRARAAEAVNRALTHPAPVLVVAHGSLFRALRAEMGHDPYLRLPNGAAYLCEPPAEPGQPWTLTQV